MYLIQKQNEIEINQVIGAGYMYNITVKSLLHMYYIVPMNTFHTFLGKSMCSLITLNVFARNRLYFMFVRMTQISDQLQVMSIIALNRRQDAEKFGDV